MSNPSSNDLRQKVLAAARKEIAGKRFVVGSPLHLIEMLINLVEESSGHETTANERTLRRLLAFAYSGSALYGDDGELQDGRHPMIDYVRDSVPDIERKIHERGMAKLAAAACPTCRYVVGHAADCSGQKASAQCAHRYYGVSGASVQCKLTAGHKEPHDYMPQE